MFSIGDASVTEGLEGDSGPDGHSLTIIAVAGYGFSFTATQVLVDSTGLGTDAQGVYTTTDGHGGYAQGTLAVQLTGAGNCSN